MYRYLHALWRHTAGLAEKTSSLVDHSTVERYNDVQKKKQSMMIIRMMMREWERNP